MAHTRIPAPVLAEFNRQIAQELGAAHNYLALSLWCADQNYQGFASWFAEQSAEERVHADKLIAHVIDRRVLPELAAIPAPKCDFKSLMDVAKHAQAMERNNTHGINLVYEAALAAKDYPTQILMHWFINEQVEEESWSTEMVERVEVASCAGGVSDLDRHLSRYLKKDVKAILAPSE